MSRNGTEAGALTLGGVEPRLHTTPMLYTSTTTSSSGGGFFNVHIRKVYLRGGTGSNSSHDSELVSLELDEDALNSGRVIVDSGTTDTYFSRHWQGEFNRVWKSFTGEDYSNKELSWTREQTETLPTIIIQLSGVSERNQQVQDEADDHDVIPGLASSVDPDHPMDVLVAIPPLHYLEYDRKKGIYQSRFYVTERSGGVIGANTMMGHDAYVDIDKKHIGWAESQCQYTDTQALYYTEPKEPQQQQSTSSTTSTTTATTTTTTTTPTPATTAAISTKASSTTVTTTSSTSTSTTSSSPKANHNDDNPGFNDATIDVAASTSAMTGDGISRQERFQMCSTLKCQLSLVLVAVSSVALVTIRLLRNRSSDGYEAAAPAEFELRERRSENKQRFDGEFGLYKDDDVSLGAYSDDEVDRELS